LPAQGRAGPPPPPPRGPPAPGAPAPPPPHTAPPPHRPPQDAAEWKAYCHFHNGEHDQALAVYQELLRGGEADPMFSLYAACCHYYLGEYREALDRAAEGPRCQLQTRVTMHASNKLGDDDRVMEIHGQLQADDLQDRLSLAALHCMRGTFEQAVQIYKKILLDHKDFAAINVYMAMCYSKLDYWDLSNEILATYLAAFPDSVLGINLKACNQLRKGVAKEAEAELRVIEELGGSLSDHALTRHNEVVIRGGQGALAALPQLGDYPREARLNLCIYHIKSGNIDEAAAVIKDVEPAQAEEFILKGVVHTMAGQAKGSAEHLRLAQEYFQTVGSSPNECDTIPGRQAMATAFFLNKSFEDTNVYLSSIAEYLAGETDFQWNYGISRAAVGDFHEGRQLLEKIEDPSLRADFTWVSWMARCLVMTGDPQGAWDLYRESESTQEAYQLLVQVANDCYRMGHFLVAARAFDVLERLDGSPESWEGKRGACVGVVQMVLAGKEPQDSVREVCQLLSAPTSQEAEKLFDVLSNWAESNGIVTDLSM